MSLFRNAESIKSQIVHIKEMLHLLNDDSLMSLSLTKRLENLESELVSIPEKIIEPKVVLLFSGSAVIGNVGIKSSFLGKTLKPFQEMIKTQVALSRFGVAPKRGRNKTDTTSDLYITSLPTGSFGVELTQLQSADLFDEQEVGNAIHEVMALIESVSKSEESFTEIFDQVPVRNINNLEKFLKQISDEGSMIKMESGTYYIELPDEKVKEAYTRVSTINRDESEIFVEGTLRGILLDSGRFEVLEVTGKQYAGFISEDIDEDTAISYDLNFLNQPASIRLKVTTTIFKNDQRKVVYELLEIVESGNFIS